MNPDFIVILQKLIAEHGREPLLNTAKCEAFLSEYTRGEYKKGQCDTGSWKDIGPASEELVLKLQQEEWDK